jgi:peptidoglycan/xylan/chitin deacetylase (PgdA/CDA1 family)
MTNLWSGNTPAQFWRCHPTIAADQWERAAKQASSVLELSQPWSGLDTLLALTLGEGQFGPHHWELGWARQMYYRFKPLLPRRFTRGLRKAHRQFAQAESLLNWPSEERFIRFQLELIKHVLVLQGWSSVDFIDFWPQGKQFALVLTHDIETSKGLSHARAVADLEEGLGFRSSFNFVAERYPIDWNLVDELRGRGFEIGVHGIYHDAKLFSSRKEFDARIRRINQHLVEFGAVGFRSPLTMRQPEWMQALEVEYDLSFFDTDPYEPIPGGTMTIWPFALGRFIELPDTLTQDHTLVRVLGQSTPRVWFEKVEVIKANYGMALLNTHPDYLLDKTTWKVYAEFLQGVSTFEGSWKALPKEVARWWKKRQEAPIDLAAAHYPAEGLTIGRIALDGEGIKLC